MLSVHRRRAPERQLRFYIFSLPSYFYLFFFCLLLFCLFAHPALSHIARNLVFRAVCDFAWYCRLALRAGDGHRPIGSVKLSAGPLEAGGKFSIRTTSLAFPLICRGAREITRRRFSFQFYFAALFRTRENFTLHRLFNSLAELLQSRSSAVNSRGNSSSFPGCFIKIKRAYACLKIAHFSPAHFIYSRSIVPYSSL